MNFNNETVLTKHFSFTFLTFFVNKNENSTMWKKYLTIITAKYYIILKLKQPLDAAATSLYHMLTLTSWIDWKQNKCIQRRKKNLHNYWINNQKERRSVHIYTQNTQPLQPIMRSSKNLLEHQLGMWRAIQTRHLDLLICWSQKPFSLID